MLKTFQYWLQGEDVKNNYRLNKISLKESEAIIYNRQLVIVAGLITAIVIILYI